MPVDPALVALSLLPRVGGKTLRNLQQHFGSFEAILTADERALRAVPGVGQKIAQAITQIDLAATKRDMNDWLRAGVQPIEQDSILYPQALKKLEDNPPVIFVRGIYNPGMWGRCIGVVGTRNPSAKAKSMARHIGAKLAQRGITVVSGMALGIDGAAHEGALSLMRGHTLAILGSGVLNIYPPQHADLALRIRQQGVLIGENHPQATANAPRLVSRNRLISSLTDALIVVESAADGGAMHAARAAYSLKVPIYTPDLPASGNQTLLRNGAICLSDDLREID